MPLHVGPFYAGPAAGLVWADPWPCRPQQGTMGPMETAARRTFLPAKGWLCARVRTFRPLFDHLGDILSHREACPRCNNTYRFVRGGIPLLMSS